MRKTTLVVCMTVAAAGLGLASIASADQLKHVTCEQFLAMDEDAQNNIVYWAEGAQVVEENGHVSAEEVDIGYDAFGRPVAEVVTACEGDRKARFFDKVKRHF